MKNTELPARRTARAPGREHPVKARLAASLVIGAVIAAALVAFEDKFRHAALAASAARPLPHGGHQTVASILASGFAGVTVIVAIAAFIVLTMRAARRRRTRLAAARSAWQDDPGSRRRGRAGSWR